MSSHYTSRTTNSTGGEGVYINVQTGNNPPAPVAAGAYRDIRANDVPMSRVSSLVGNMGFGAQGQDCNASYDPRPGDWTDEEAPDILSGIQARLDNANYDTPYGGPERGGARQTTYPADQGFSHHENEAQYRDFIPWESRVYPRTNNPSHHPQPGAYSPHPPRRSEHEHQSDRRRARQRFDETVDYRWLDDGRRCREPSQSRPHSQVVYGEPRRQSERRDYYDGANHGNRDQADANDFQDSGYDRGWPYTDGDFSYATPSDNYTDRRRSHASRPSTEPSSRKELGPDSVPYMATPRSSRRPNVVDPRNQRSQSFERPGGSDLRRPHPPVAYDDRRQYVDHSSTQVPSRRRAVPECDVADRFNQSANLSSRRAEAGERNSHATGGRHSALAGAERRSYLTGGWMDTSEPNQGPPYPIYEDHIPYSRGLSHGIPSHLNVEPFSGQRTDGRREAGWNQGYATEPHHPIVGEEGNVVRAEQPSAYRQESRVPNVVPLQPSSMNEEVQSRPQPRPQAESSAHLSRSETRLHWEKYLCRGDSAIVKVTEQAGRRSKFVVREKGRKK